MELSHVAASVQITRTPKFSIGNALSHSREDGNMKKFLVLYMAEPAAFETMMRNATPNAKEGDGGVDEVDAHQRIRPVDRRGAAMTTKQVDANGADSSAASCGSTPLTTRRVEHSGTLSPRRRFWTCTASVGRRDRENACLRAALGLIVADRGADARLRHIARASRSRWRRAPCGRLRPRCRRPFDRLRERSMSSAPIASLEQISC